MRELALFAGAGGGILGGLLLGWSTVCAVEIDPYCRRVLLARQRDGILPPFPIWDDVRTFDAHPWRGSVDVVSGGFPCQDISPVGPRTGLDGARSGLWSEYARIVRAVRPRYVFVENSAALVSNGLARVLADLAALGFDARWGVLSACATGAPHTRERLFLVADADGFDGEAWVGVQQERQGAVWGDDSAERACGYTEVRVAARSGADRMANGLAHRLERTRAAGNGQVPHCMALAWLTLRGGVDQ